MPDIHEGLTTFFNYAAVQYTTAALILGGVATMITFRLTGRRRFPWWVIFAPLWVPFVIGCLLAVFNFL